MTRIQPNRRYAKTINISTKQFLPSLTGTQYFLTDSLFGSNTIKNYKRLKNINFYLFLKFHTINMHMMCCSTYKIDSNLFL